MRFHFEQNGTFSFGCLVNYNCLHDTNQNETIAGPILLRSF